MGDIIDYIIDYDGVPYDDVSATTNRNRIIKMRVPIDDNIGLDVIENPYYGGEDLFIDNRKPPTANVQRKDPGFQAIKVVENIYYDGVWWRERKFPKSLCKIFDSNLLK